VAICLNAWCFDRAGVFHRARATQLFAGYHSVRPFAAAEVAAFPRLARGAAVRFLLTRVYDTLHQPNDALVRLKEPLDYLKRPEFHRVAEGPSAYGLD
jgi:homoserine kinase type II